MAKTALLQWPMPAQFRTAPQCLRSRQQIALANELPVLAEIKAYASHSRHPAEFTLAPDGAIEKVLKHTG